MSQSSKTFNVAAAAVVSQGRLLLVRKRGTAVFMLPGGKLEPGESDRECLFREIEEELGTQALDPATHLGTFEADAANEPDHRVVARVYRVSLRNEPKTSREIAELAWCDLDHPAKHLALAPLVAKFVIPQLRRQL
ncbi:MULTISPECIES: NUDIX domain-containing protein [unclassified Bradyrhizobium]|uniref:NUDIX hydrolase n=1 Tax=unclassified Bradyrhizobium TaxID=2631580 RepID=UPI0028EC5A82|nr:MULTISPECIES: NUDIX domain-containing protein [unclassified Bradyrhizobium]